MPRNLAAELAPYIGPTPTEPGQSVAIGYHRRIVHTLEHWPDGFDGALRRALMKRERTWRPRAAGTDRRWNRLGGRAGRTPEWIARELYPPHPAYAAPVTDDDMS